MSQWILGTSGLYPRPIGVSPPHICPQSFPVWNIPRAVVVGKNQYLLLQAGIVCTVAFYLAADICAQVTQLLGFG